MMPLLVVLLLLAGLAICAGMLLVLRREDSGADERSQDIKDFKAKYPGRARGER